MQVSDGRGRTKELTFLASVELSPSENAGEGFCISPLGQQQELCPFQMLCMAPHPSCSWCLGLCCTLPFSGLFLLWAVEDLIPTCDAFLGLPKIRGQTKLRE